MGTAGCSSRQSVMGRGRLAVRISLAGMLNVQDFISDEHDLFVQVTYCGYTVKGAKLWDFSDKIVTNAENGVAFQKLTATDRDKAGRIEDVLLGNARRF